MKQGDRVRFRDSCVGLIEGVIDSFGECGFRYCGATTRVLTDAGTSVMHHPMLDGQLELVGPEVERSPDTVRLARGVPAMPAPATPPASASLAAPAITAECDALKAMLLEKNAAYGNSVFAPVGIFSRLPVRERLLVRIEDKLSRLRGGTEFPGDDTIKDLIGYLILYRIAARSAA